MKTYAVIRTHKRAVLSSVKYTVPKLSSSHLRLIPGKAEPHLYRMIFLGRSYLSA